MSAKTKPKPIKFDEGEWSLIKLLGDKKGVSAADIVRRSFRLLMQEIDRRGGDWDWVEETAKPIDVAKLMVAKTRSESQQTLKKLLVDVDATRRQRERARDDRSSSKPRRAS